MLFHFQNGVNFLTFLKGEQSCVLVGFSLCHSRDFCAGFGHNYSLFALNLQSARPLQAFCSTGGAEIFQDEAPNDPNSAE